MHDQHFARAMPGKTAAGLVDRGEGQAKLLGIPPARNRQPDAIGMTGEQRFAEPAFKCPDVLRDRGRRDIQFNAGASERAEPPGGLEGPKPIQRQVCGGHDTLNFSNPPAR